MTINKIDVIWNYIATFFRVASSAILLPLILRFLPAEEVGVWALFSSISALIFLLDFGFNSSFTRNVTYVFSGAHILEAEGITKVDNIKNHVNYELLKGLISAMRWFYGRVSMLLLALLITVGSFYIYHVLKDYSGNQVHIYLSWGMFCVINTYNLYTLYYDALLEGKGLIRVAKKITIIGNLTYLAIAALLVLNGFGLLALVSSQFIAVLIIRILSYRVFFTVPLKKELDNAANINNKDILAKIYPNAFKYGITSLGGFMIQRSSIFIGATFISLVSIASFGVTRQLLEVLVAVANIALATYLPKIAKLRLEDDIQSIKVIYIRGIILSNAIFISGALILYYIGPIFLAALSSHTKLVSQNVLLAMIFSSWIGLNAGISGAVISTRNVIPFMKPSLYSGIATILLLLLVFNFTNFGILGMAIVPGLVDLCYQGWKWPYEVFKELQISLNDFRIVVKKLILR
ncbi:hypothetical protein FFJ24_019845 [Pedobacter sp. KBS0701]|uniref:O-unit flippase-like protein n=1 Tax=Pedobacter sp. KBS0701 TaxID=2578106 RepID=UPI00110F517F|nr:O-unit flippase-like protein [Pedobacter sp. KBS0701]QDW26947.1 hypothetical protein FFJ24_019845 [Pedobacter sp. KBS0701]